MSANARKIVAIAAALVTTFATAMLLALRSENHDAVGWVFILTMFYTVPAALAFLAGFSAAQSVARRSEALALACALAGPSLIVFAVFAVLATQHLRVWPPSPPLVVYLRSLHRDLPYALGMLPGAFIGTLILFLGRGAGDTARSRP